MRRKSDANAVELVDEECSSRLPTAAVQADRWQGNVTNAGLIAVGDASATIGQLSVTGALSSTGTLAFDLANTASFDSLSVGGAAALTDGVIEVTLVGGFNPASGDSFQVLAMSDYNNLTFSSVEFNFDNAALTGGLLWDTSTFTTDGNIRVSAVPEPASLSLLLLGLLGVGRFWRRAA